MNETRENPPWGWLTAIGLPVAHLLIQIALTVGGSGVLLLALWATSRLDPDSVAASANNGVFLGGLGALGGLGTLALIWAVVTHLRKRPFRATIRLTGRAYVWRAAFGAVLLGGLMDVVTLALRKPIVPDELRPLFTGTAGAAAMTVFAVVVTPLVEELLFRGVLFPVAARSLGALGGVLLVSGLFGLAHVVTYGLDAYLIAQTLLAGLYLTWLRARTGSLVPSVAAHTALNLYATLEAIVLVNGIK
jgi:membrane protease YdiL (CAAX protease family)